MTPSSGTTEAPGGPGSPSGTGDPPPPPSGRVPKRPRPVFLVIGLVVAAGLGVGLFLTRPTPGASTNSPGPRVGAPVPAFSLPTLGGGPAVGVPGEGGARGRPAVLVFFASWCGPCQSEIPALASLYRSQTAGGAAAKVALIGVDGSDPTHNALGFVHAAGVTFPVGVDPDYAVTEGLFAFTGLPESVMVRGDGTIAHVTYGALSASQLRAWERVLATPNGR